MTQSTQTQHDPLRLAEHLRDMCSAFKTQSHEKGVINGAIQELRRLHDHCAALEAKLEEIGKAQQ